MAEVTVFVDDVVLGRLPAVVRQGGVYRPITVTVRDASGRPRIRCGLAAGVAGAGRLDHSLGHLSRPAGAA